MNLRMLPPASGPYQTMQAHGRSYSGTPGQTFDIPDFDADILQANGWVRVALSGPTSARPAAALGVYAAMPGGQFYDTTLSKFIVFDGATWRDPATGSAV